MEINRRVLLTSGAALAGFSYIDREGRVEGAENPDLPKDGITLTAMVKAKPGEEQAVKEALLSMVKPTRKETGCICYNLHQSKSEPTQFMFYEQWASKEALDAHGKTPHMKALGGKLWGKTDKGGGVVFYNLLD